MNDLCNLLNFFEEFPSSFVNFSLNTKENLQYKKEEDDKNYIYKIIVPDCEKEDIELSYVEEDSKLYLMFNFKKDSFILTKNKYKVIVPKDVDCKNITSFLKNGILKVLLPKKEKVKNEYTININ